MLPTHGSARILRPARRLHILFGLVVALALDLFPWGRVPGVPGFTALVLTFWCVREPLQVGLISAFVLGIVIDVAQGSVMGQHALSYVVLAFGAVTLSRRILWFTYFGQALHVLPLLLLAQITQMVVGLAAGGEFPGWSYFLSSFVSTALWYPLGLLLLWPQFRPDEKDENRPI